MDAMEAILTRRSIRQYQPGNIPEETVKLLLEAGMSAPSAKNEQPWHFIVINQRDRLDEIPLVHPFARMMNMASLAIVVCADTQVADSIGFWVQDCSAATQNILLAAHASGLGAVWLGVYPREDRVKAVQALMALPEHIIPLCIIAAGYPAEKKARENRYQQSRVHYNHW